MKKKRYIHLSQNDRDRIEALLKQGHEQKEIAEVLKVNKSTISREIKRNRRNIRSRGGNKDGPYESTVAHHKAYLKRKYSKYQGKEIVQNDGLREYIIKGLKKHWNPDEIAGRMKLENQPFYASKNTIYAWLYSAWGQRYCKYLYSKRYHPKKQNKNKTGRVLIPNKKPITERPIGAINKTRYGRFESDTIVSGKRTRSKAALTVSIEVKTKYAGVRKIKNLKPLSNLNAILDINRNLQKVLSITFDNGIENTKHESIGVPTYFCDPYSSWQKPHAENVNKMIRRYIPKGSDISKYSDSYVKMAVDKINNKPRKSLNYQTAKELMIKNNLLKNASNFTRQKVALGGRI